MPLGKKKNPQVVFAYARALMSNYQDQEAESLVRKTLSSHWYPPLVNLYGRLQLKEIHGQVRVAESWLKHHDTDAELLLALGRLMVRIEQWELARDYFQRSLRLHKNLETTMELANLMDKLGDHKASAEFYRQGLVLVEHRE